MEEKKASDILLEIQQDIKEIKGIIKDLSFKYALILERLGRNNNPKIEVPVSSSVPKPAPIELPKAKPSPFEQTPNLKEKLQKALAQAKTSSGEEVDFPQRNIRKIPVQQRILNADGKGIYMAAVEIYDNQSQLVHKGNTNQIGKWQISLSPGDYTVKISKSSSPNKPAVELTYSVTIPDKDSLVELEPKKVTT